MTFTPSAITTFCRMMRNVRRECFNGLFCVDYTRNAHLPRPLQGCRHPTQLYEMLKNWVLAVVLWFMLRRWQPPRGGVFWSFIGLYGLVRFFLMFVRDEQRFWLGLTQSQIFSGVMALLGGAMVAGLLVRSRYRTVE